MSAINGSRPTDGMPPSRFVEGNREELALVRVPSGAEEQARALKVDPPMPQGLAALINLVSGTGNVFDSESQL
jgi:hypothetical protein